MKPCISKIRYLCLDKVLFFVLALGVAFMATPMSAWALHLGGTTGHGGAYTSVPAEDRAAYDRDGFIIKHNYLPDDVFKRLRDEVYGKPLPAREMRQGQTVTRMMTILHRPTSCSQRSCAVKNNYAARTMSSAFAMSVRPRPGLSALLKIWL